MTDGRLLVLLGLLGLTGAAVARGSRGVVRAGRKAAAPAIYTLRIWGQGRAFYDEGFEGGSATKRILLHSPGVRFVGGSPSVDDRGMWYLEGIEIPSDRELETVRGLQAALKPFMDARDDVVHWSLEPS